MELEIPKCVGFIMDGNRRWAEREGKQSYEGHIAGYSALKKVMQAVKDARIPHMICYAFSTENWNRTEKEVEFLMNLMRQAIAELKKEDSAEKVNFRIVGQVERFPEDVQTEIKAFEAHNHTDPAFTLWIALSYGGRAEMLHAAQRMIDEGVSVATEETFRERLWTAGMPDPDLIIRTSGEKRISNFLLWQSAYSEFLFTDTLWPDFGEVEFKSMVEEYGKRHRRRGA